MVRPLNYDDIEYISSQIKDNGCWLNIFSHYFSYNRSVFRISLVNNMCSKLSIDLMSINSENYPLLKERVIPHLFSDPKFIGKLKNNLIAPYDKKHQTNFVRLIFGKNRNRISDQILNFPQNLIDKFVIDYCILRKLHLVNYNGKGFLSDIDEDIRDCLSYYHFYNAQMLSDNTKVNFVNRLMEFSRQLFIDNMAKILELTLYKYEKNIATRLDYDTGNVIKSLLNIEDNWRNTRLSNLSDATKELFNSMNMVFSQSIEEDIEII